MIDSISKSSVTDSGSEVITLIIVDDNKKICHALESLFRSSNQIDVVAVSYSAEEGVKLSAEFNPDVILLDLEFPEEEIDGIEAIRRISSNPDIDSRVLVYTILGKGSTVFEAIKAGADSYVWKDEEHTDLIEAVLATARGEAFASPEIARLVLEFFERAQGFFETASEA